MRRFLVIGCGGSGGGTLRFLMDQLRADLAPYGVTSLPAGWQFLHIDVPVVADSGPGRLGSVPDQGGQYFSLSYQQAEYSDIAAGVERQLRYTAGLNALQSWQPDPAKVSVDITEGAGQYRAIGRILTLHRARDGILPELRAAWNRVQAASVHHEMQALVHDRKVPGLGEYKYGAPPIILVVSSMAGGSGASMVLDIARMLNMIEGVSPGHIGLFLFSPEVFDGLKSDDRTGIEANGAAALAELIASQARADDRVEWEPRSGGALRDVAESSDALRALGMVGTTSLASFGSVFPFGAMIGDSGAKLGDGMPETIYRALGRGLAALMMAGEATEAFIQYDLTNKGVVGNREQFGWGVDPSNVSWGSFGYASLSLGRDRYAEYAAQRIARIAVDRLERGHMQPGEVRSGIDVVRALVDSQLPQVLQRLQLPATGQKVSEWFSSALPKEASQQLGAGIVSSHVAPLVTADRIGSNSSQWLASVTAQVTNIEQALRQAVEHAAQRWANNWYQSLVSRVVEETGRATSALSLPVAVALLERLRAQVELMLPDLGRAAARNPNPAELPGATRDKLTSWVRARNAVVNPNAMAETVREGYSASVNTAYRLRCATLVYEILSTMGEDLLKPLEDAARSALVDVEAARKAISGHVGIAAVRTSEYAAWPEDSETNVPGRFDNAENEVLLTTSRQYPGLFEAHLREMFLGVAPAEIRERTSQSVIWGRWDSVSGHAAPDNLLECRASWRPAALPVDPESGRIVVASRAKYRVHVSTDEVLQRARAYVARPGQKLDDYVRQSLADFVRDGSGGDAQHDSARHERELLVIERFREALSLSRPVVGVSDNSVSHLHGGLSRADRKAHKFGQIPFQNMPIEEKLAEVIKDPATGLSQSTQSSFARAVAPASTATRIDIFGSTPSYFPLVFTSFLKPIAARWSAGSQASRIEFWKWRRARPLAEFLPMGQAQRRALVAGWLVGRVVGMVRVPDDFGSASANPVTVWDVSRNQWLAFPDPLVVPRRELVDYSDVMAAVLESMVLALADSHASPDQEPLRPYTALRCLFDDAAQDPTPEGRIDTYIGADHLARWLASGQTRSGESVIETPPEASFKQRQEALIEWLDAVHDDVSQWEASSSNRLDPQRPRRTDLAAELRWATTRLRGIAVNPPPIRTAEPGVTPTPPPRRQGPRL